MRSSTEQAFGSYSLQAGTISHSQTSCFSIAGVYNEINFYKKMSSEENFDFLRFYIDDVKQAEWSGQDTSFSPKNYQASATSHTFKWCYEKDAQGIGNSDTAWIDHIVLKKVSYMRLPRPLLQPPGPNAMVIPAWCLITKCGCLGGILLLLLLFSTMSGIRRME
ncbi:hypothetical protein WDW89_15855 [Deltaproteobacteria bacterium TL4]